MPIYCRLFDSVLNSWIIPKSWSEGVVFPIFKNKGDTKDPRSYMPISLVSCLGKTFTAVLNDRLCELLDEVGLISESQIGFRKGYSTLDNKFSLHALISLGTKLYCTFVDFSKVLLHFSGVILVLDKETICTLSFLQFIYCPPEQSWKCSLALTIVRSWCLVCCLWTFQNIPAV